METSRVKPAHADVISKRRNDLENYCASFIKPNSTIVWEVGCGHGHFLTAYAEAHCDSACVGIDLVRDRIARAERKQARAGLSNLHFVQAEARDFLEAIPATTRLSAIYMLFPDPWPKRRHHKHRLLDSQFLTAVAERAGEGVRFHFRTDHEAYFADAKATFASHSDWDTCLSAEWSFELPTVFQQKAPSYQSLVAIRNSH